MKIESLKELQKVIALCRKTGVQSIKVDGIELILGAEPRKASKSLDYSSDFPEASVQVPQFQGYSTPISSETIDFTISNDMVAAQMEALDTQQIADKIAISELTEEQLLFYSAQGHIEQ